MVDSGFFAQCKAIAWHKPVLALKEQFILICIT